MNDQLLTQEEVRDLLKKAYSLTDYSLRSAVRWLTAQKIENVGPSRKVPRYSRAAVLAQLNFHVPKNYEPGKVLTVKAALAGRGKP